MQRRISIIAQVIEQAALSENGGPASNTGHIVQMIAVIKDFGAHAGDAITDCGFDEAGTILKSIVTNTGDRVRNRYTCQMATTQERKTAD